jgi:ArsR family transcriptional regulator
MFRALSDRTRLRIVHLLRQGETCVCDLVAVIKSPQPKISRHLAYLRRAGIVDARRDGQWIYYRLAPAKSRLHEKLLECLDACSVEVPELNRDAERLTRSGRSCCD